MMNRLIFVLSLVLGGQVIASRECRLPHRLTEEIRSYQPIVNRIAAAVVNGQYAGNTWQR